MRLTVLLLLMATAASAQSHIVIRAGTLIDGKGGVAKNQEIVIDDGRIVENGLPQSLAGRNSRYRSLLDAEERLRKGIWAGELWRHVEIRDGRILAHSKRTAAWTR